MEKEYTFKHSELVSIIQELSKLPYGQVAKIINFIDEVASKGNEPKVEDQINKGIEDSQSE
jgi:hypothetical protein